MFFSFAMNLLDPNFSHKVAFANTIAIINVIKTSEKGKKLLCGTIDSFN